MFTILAIHVVLLGALLLQGCKRTTTQPEEPGDLTTPLPPFEPTTNVFVPPPDIGTFTPPPAPTPVQPPSAPTTPPDVGTFTPPPPPERFVPPPPEEIKPPAPAPTPITPPPAGNREHIVVKNDSFYSLGQQYGVPWKAIAAANPGVDSRRLKIGQTLLIPPAVEPPAPGESTAETGAGTIYEVKSGDTLWEIGKRFGTSDKELRRVNNLPTSFLRVGQKLKIPAAKPTGN